MHRLRRLGFHRFHRRGGHRCRLNRLGFRFLHRLRDWCLRGAIRRDGVGLGGSSGCQRRRVAHALGHLAVIVHEIVFLNDRDQRVGVARIAGIASLLQPVRPRFVVGDGQIEELDVAAALRQKQRMVAIGLFHCGIFPETVLAAVVLRLVKGGAGPLLGVAHDAEMVVSLLGDAVGAAFGGIDSLCQRDARGHLVLFHLPHGQILILIDIIIDLVFQRVLGITGGDAKQEDAQKQNSFHNRKGLMF